MTGPSRRCRRDHATSDIAILLTVVMLGGTPAAAIPAEVEGPSLSLSPICGTADSTITLAGRGWKPGNDCDSVRYAYYWDSAPFKCSDAALEDCKVFGPPYGSGDDRIDCGIADKLYKGAWYMRDILNSPDTPLPDICLRVPEDSDPGTHVLKVSLEIKRLAGPWQEKQCAVAEWEQLSTIEQPWRPAPAIWPEPTQHRSAIKITFDPKDVCDVPPCSLLVFIQAVRHEGEFNGGPGQPGGSIRAMTPGELLIRKAEFIETFTSASGFYIDNDAWSSNPYYIDGIRASDPLAPGQPGFRGDSPSKGTKKSWMQDTPGHIDPWPRWPQGMTKAIWHYEFCAFCGSGEGAGRYLGNGSWRWEYTPQMNVPQIIPGALNRASAPSAGLAAALEAFEAVFSWIRPTPQEQQEGGEPCGQ